MIFKIAWSGAEAAATNPICDIGIISNTIECTSDPNSSNVDGTATQSETMQSSDMTVNISG